MNEEMGGQGAWRGVPEEEAIRRLLRDAGPRPALPREDLAAAESAAREEWNRRFGAGRKRKLAGRWWLAVAAAALAGAIGLVWWGGRQQTVIPPGRSAASIEVWTGDVRVTETAGRAPRVLSPGMAGTPLAEGSALRTARGEAEGRLALRMAGGASVRLDAGTSLRLASREVVELSEGAVYVDSGAGPASRGVAVRTAAGLFQERGTQFEVRTEGSGVDAVTRLRVREGRVELHRLAGSAVITKAGYQLVVSGPGDPVQSPAAGYGPEWDWVVQSAPMPAIEGMKVRTFLDWLGRETGWRVELADARAASLADSVVLHGSIRHLTLLQAPAVVLSSAGLRHRVSGGTMVVSVLEPEELRTPR
jgi:hypothetical protein